MSIALAGSLCNPREQTQGSHGQWQDPEPEAGEMWRWERLVRSWEEENMAKNLDPQRKYVMGIGFLAKSKP